DVFEVEPLPADSPLRDLPNVVMTPRARDLPNVVMTPHCAGSNVKAIAAMSARCVENVLAVLNDQDPGADYVLNPEVIGQK
ncbi:MAG: hypothetical protein AAF637_21130, partial [Pseudomonadota bacterium]